MAFTFKTVTDYTPIARAREAQTASTNASITDATRAVATNAVERNAKKEFPDDPYGQEALKFRITRLQGANPVGAEMYRKMLDDLQSTEAVGRKADVASQRYFNKLTTPFNYEKINPDTGEKESLVLQQRQGDGAIFNLATGKQVPPEELQGYKKSTSDPIQNVKITPPSVKQVFDVAKALQKSGIFNSSAGGPRGIDSTEKQQVAQTLANYAQKRAAEDQSANLTPKQIEEYVAEGMKLLVDENGNAKPGLLIKGTGLFAGRLPEAMGNKDVNLNLLTELLNSPRNSRKEKEVMPETISALDFESKLGKID